MDKFVIRMPKPTFAAVSTASNRGGKQVKLESLKGVVVIEEIERAKVILDRRCNPALMIKTLKSLEMKRPSKEILIKSQIGKSVHKLCKYSDADVAALARKVYDLWKADVLRKENRPMIEVKCDARAEALRTKARQMIFDSFIAMYKPKEISSSETKIEKCLESSVEDKSENTKSKFPKTSHVDNLKLLSEHIEREVFRRAKNRVGVPYKRANRKIIFALKYKEDLNLKVVNSNLTVEKLVHNYFQD